MAKVLVIDDEESIQNALKGILKDEGYEVTLASEGKEGIELIRQNKFDVVLLDIKMPQMDGVEALDDIFNITSDIPVIMITGHGNVENAVESIKKGAFDFLQKPLDLNRLLITIRNAIDKSDLLSETKALKRRVTKTYDIIGESEPIVKVKQMIERVAPTEAKVLITGDNGTGKELVARWLHEKSQRRDAPFVEVNCAAIPSELIESELFGHEKGAFTSAYHQKKGKFEQANGGTLFLDEIGDMSLSAQSKVLRALQEKKITRVGSEKQIDVDVRIITATNKNLNEHISNKNFREDLYHRLSVIIINVPSLDERKEDIPLLTDYFIKDICREYGMTPIGVSDEAFEELKKINWTGNIRELRNVIERLIILAEEEITADDVKNFAQPLSIQ